MVTSYFIDLNTLLYPDAHDIPYSEFIAPFFYHTIICLTPLLVHIILPQTLKIKREKIQKHPKSKFTQLINATREIFGFMLAIICLIIGFTYVKIMVVNYLRLMLNQSSITLDFIVVVLPWISFYVFCLLCCCQPLWLTRI